MGLCHHQVMARAENEEYFFDFYETCPLIDSCKLQVTFTWSRCFINVKHSFDQMPPEDEVLRLILEVGDFTDQGTRRSGEHSDRVNCWVGSDRNQYRMWKQSCMCAWIMWSFTLFLGLELWENVPRWPGYWPGKKVIMGNAWIGGKQIVVLCVSQFPKALRSCGRCYNRVASD